MGNMGMNEYLQNIYKKHDTGKRIFITPIWVEPRLQLVKVTSLFLFD